MHSGDNHNGSSKQIKYTCANKPMRMLCAVLMDSVHDVGSTHGQCV